MKNRIILLVLFMTFATPLFADAQKDRPYIPVSQGRATVVMTGVATTHNSAFLNDSLLAPTLNFSSIQPTYALNHIKGDLGELMMDRVFTGTFLERTGGWGRLTPTAVGRNGIDGLYVKMDKFGNPQGLIVADAKVNSAQLGKTKNGKQMSRQWITPHLSRTAETYTKLANELLDQNTVLIRAKRIPDNILQSKLISIPINDKSSVSLWKTPKGYAYYSRNSKINPEDVRVQCVRSADFLNERANILINWNPENDSPLPYRPRLFAYKAEAGQHVLSFKKLDANANVIRGETNSIRIPPFIPGKSYDKKFEHLQKAFEQSVKDLLSEQKNIYGLPKYSEGSLKSTLEECCKDPQKCNKICVRPKATPTSVRIATTITTSTILVGGLDVVTQYTTTGGINWRQTGAITLLTGTSTVVGLAASSGLQALGCSTAMSTLGGGSVAGVMMAYSMYAMGYCSLTQANINALAGLAATGAIVATPAVMTAIAVTFGSASTGTAISALHGAAATNAILYWWGNITVGGGMAADSTTIAVVTGGIAIVVAAIPAIIMTYKYFSDVRSQHRYLSGMIDIVSDRVNRGDQVEWSNLQLAPR